jgi:hypothetical protein
VGLKKVHTFAAPFGFGIRFRANKIFEILESKYNKQYNKE